MNIPIPRPDGFSWKEEIDEATQLTQRWVGTPEKADGAYSESKMLAVTNAFTTQYAGFSLDGPAADFESAKSLAENAFFYLVEMANIAGSVVASNLPLLSGRERDVARLLIAGKRMSAIAKTLKISQHTARNHLKHVFRKLGVHSQVEMIAALRGSVV